MPYPRECRRAAMRNALLLGLFATTAGFVPTARAIDPHAANADVPSKATYERLP